MPTYVCSVPAGSLFTVMHIIKLFDYQKPYSNYILAKVLALALLLFVLPARAQQDPNLRQIAAFPDHQVTGITGDLVIRKSGNLPKIRILLCSGWQNEKKKRQSQDFGENVVRVGFLVIKQFNYMHNCE